MSLLNATPTPRRSTALVLAGGGARGAYEAGVLAFVLGELRRRSRRSPSFDLFAGTSVGGLHCCFLAARAKAPEQGAQELLDYWHSLEIGRVLRFGPSELLNIGRLFLGPRFGLEGLWPPRRREAPQHHAPVAGIFDVSPLRHDMARLVPWEELDHNLNAGVVQGVALCATEVCSGKATVFHQLAPGGRFRSPTCSSTLALPVRLRVEHAMASAAMPFVFPAEQVDGVCYVDGGLRRNTPLGPSLRMGAERVLVVSLQQAPEHELRRARLGCRSNPYPGALFLLGRLVGALMNEALEDEIRRTETLSQVLESGAATAGPQCLTELNDARRAAGQQDLRAVETLLLRPSRSLEELALECAEAAPDELRLPGATGQALRRLLQSRAFLDSDLLGFVLFTPTYIRRLIELGYSDAEARSDELAAFFS